MPLTYLYNDGDIFAVYKPAGVHSVQLPQGGGASVADELLTENPSLSESSRTAGDAGLVNRLDAGTSGLLLGATKRATWEELFALSMEGKISKTYVALLEGEFTDSETITSFIGTPNRGAKKVKVYEKEPPAWARALEGTTTYTAHRYLPSLDATVVYASASPARRHQVRAHAAHLGYPLLGDTLYGAVRLLPSSSLKQREFFLHAAKICFTHPLSQEAVTIECPFEGHLSILENE
jgi:23S rRNA pseudouridine1911/1915/1917 synthase